MLKMLKLISVVLISFMLFACQESNPLIGTWDVVTTWNDSNGKHTKTSVVEYTKDSVKGINSDGKVFENKVKYEKRADKEWVLIFNKPELGKEFRTYVIILDDGSLYSRNLVNGTPGDIVGKGIKRK